MSKLNDYYHGEPFTWELSSNSSYFSNFANVADDYSSLQNISWTLKRDPQDDEDGQYLQLLWDNGANSKFSFNPVKHTISVIIEPDDYALIPNQDITYEIVIAFQVSEYTQWIELRADFEENGDKIRIVKDKHRL